MKEFLVGSTMLLSIVCTMFIYFMFKIERKHKAIVYGVPTAVMLLASISSGLLYIKLSEKEEIAAAEITLSTGSHKVQVTAIHPPKHYKVTFVDLETNQTHSQAIGKHCNTYRQISVGGVYDIAISIKKNPRVSEREYLVYSELDMRKVFCPSR